MSLNVVRGSQTYLPTWSIFGHQQQVDKVRVFLGQQQLQHDGESSHDLSSPASVVAVSDDDFSGTTPVPDEEGYSTRRISNNDEIKRKKIMSLKEFLDRNNAALNNMVEDDEGAECDDTVVQAWEVEDIDDHSVITFLRTLPQQMDLLQNGNCVVLLSEVVLDDDDNDDHHDNELSFCDLEVKEQRQRKSRPQYQPQQSNEYFKSLFR